jgi:hypothetical protein
VRFTTRLDEIEVHAARGASVSAQLCLKSEAWTLKGHWLKDDDAFSDFRRSHGIKLILREIRAADVTFEELKNLLGKERQTDYRVSGEKVVASTLLAHLA